MDIKEVVVSRSCRVNTGNYEGTEHFISMRAELDELDSAADVTQQLSAEVERAMCRQLYRSYAVRGKALTPAQVSKHHGFTHVCRESEEHEKQKSKRK